MKLWFFARTDESEYLYIRVNSYSQNEIAYDVADINKLGIFKVKSILFDDFAKKSKEQIYISSVNIKGNKCYFHEEDEIILRESSFFAKDILKRLPKIPSNIGKTEIVRECYKHWSH
jgi:hypothetical protein